MGERQKAIEISELRYGVRNHWTYRLTELLHGLTLDVYVGESFGFLGHNGAGKTTSIKCILGLLKPQFGTIKIFGLDSHETASRAQIGYLAEQPYFYDHLTVTETMELYATLAGVPKQDLKESISTALDLVKVSSRQKSPLRSLSKGLTQRVGMAQAIVAKPRLLILDEPFSGLDPIGRKEFKDLLKHLKDGGATIFMASHILSDVEFLCERVSILSRGTFKGIFEVADIPRLSGGSYELEVGKSPTAIELLTPLGGKSIDAGRFVVFTFNSREGAEKALHLAIQNHMHVESFNFNQGSLEDLFVKLVQFDEGGA